VANVPVAQLVERHAYIVKVLGSNPSWGTSNGGSHMNKSLIDGMKIKEEGAFFNKSDKVPQPPFQLEIISYCPRCSSPYYGKKIISEGESPVIKRSCSCIIS
jgi:hypothetical protein